MTRAEERFLKYVTFDTESKLHTQAFPSTPGQKIFGQYLVEEMKSIGIADANMDQNGYVFGTIPGNIENKNIPVIGFISHMDTAEAVTGKNVKARIEKNYQGGDIVLNKEKEIIMRREEYEILSTCIGKDLIVTDGTTLLGADNKAGIAEIMTAAEYMLHTPDFLHGTVKIGFTPDEEVGRGAEFFDVERFGAVGAYTIDGGELGDIQYENFNAAGVRLKIHGVSIHPGSAKNKMVNSILIAMELQGMLPVAQNPAYTENREGFYHLDKIAGDVEMTELYYLIRDHDKVLFTEKKERFTKIVDYLNEKYGAGTVEMDMYDTYYNMKEKIEPHMYLIDNALKAMDNLGVTPIPRACRGGTDGCVLSYKGLPCPNISSGGCNVHSRYEFVAVQDMEKITQLILEIIRITAQNAAEK